MPSLLIASHIKPWSECAPVEKTHIHNVLCLDRDYDGLLDAFRITVTADLDVKYDPRLSKEIGEDLFERNFARFDRIREDCITELNIPGEKYLAYHNAKFKKKCGESAENL